MQINRAVNYLNREALDVLEYQHEPPLSESAPTDDVVAGSAQRNDGRSPGL
jgi:hypothetical protein